MEPVEERLWGGLTERLMVATAASYVVSPAALGPIGADPARNNDRLSASYLLALAARIVREETECAPCRLRECPIDHRCMARVRVERVAATALELLAA